LIQELAYNFASSELEPNAAEWDKKKHFPKDVYKKAAELGFAGIYVREENGGCGLGRLESSLIFEGLSTGKQESVNFVQGALGRRHTSVSTICALG
jgi:alkylation response protein AidB-like acyl-CoA dehydrogenase